MSISTQISFLDFDFENYNQSGEETSNWFSNNLIKNESQISFKVPYNSNSNSNSNESQQQDISGGNFGEIPSFYTEISAEGWRTIIGYAVLFVLAAIGNLAVLFSVIKTLRKRFSPMNKLLLHLCIADLIVVFTVIPIEIGWRIYIGWYAGEFMCKFLQFVRAFGLYLSSIMLVCISLDRYFAIVHPLKVMGSSQRVRKMLIIAWISSTIFSIPQAIIFQVESHPDYPVFKQCMSSFLGERAEILNTSFSLMIMYFLPLVTIAYTYSRIIHKIFKESSRARDDTWNSSTTSSGGDNRICTRKSIKMSKSVPGSVHYCKSTTKDKDKDRDNKMTDDDDHSTDGSEVIVHVDHQSNGGGLKGHQMSLRRSGPSNLEKARIRTIKLTCCIVTAFLVTWTPYVFINVWCLLDYSMASSLSPWILDALFIMAVANSFANPLIYGLFYIRRKTESSSRPTVSTTVDH